MGHYSGMHVCSFSVGVFSVQSPNGGQGLNFDDSDQFGPSQIDLRKDELSDISPRHKWFWDWYPRWVAAGRPTVRERTYPHGVIRDCDVRIPATPIEGADQ